jgi:hypothetical protein
MQYLDAWAKHRNPSAIQKARLFFAVQLPGMIQRERVSFDCAAGVLAVVVVGAGGYTIRFGNHLAADAVTEEVDPAADAIATCDADELMAWLAQRHDSLMHLVSGDGKLLTRLLRLTQAVPTAGWEGFGTAVSPPMVPMPSASLELR